MAGKSSRGSKRGKATVRTKRVRLGDGRRKRAENTRSRRCGPCTACCSAMSVDELGKPEWTACAHLHAPEHAHAPDGTPSRVPVRVAEEHLRQRGSGGCGIYRERPSSCAKFRCQWLAGMPLTEDRHRPDRCGLMILDTPDPRSVQVRELWAGAASTGVGRDLITSLRRARLEVIVVSPGEERTLTPLTVFGAPEVQRA